MRGDDSTARAPCPNKKLDEDLVSRNSLQRISNLNGKKPLLEPQWP